MKLKRTCASIAAASLLFGLGVTQAQAYGTAYGHSVGNLVDGWAPVGLHGSCGDAAKHAVISVSPAASVKPVTGDQGSVEGDALRFQKPLKGDERWNVLVSATGSIKVNISCVASYNYSTKTITHDLEIDTTKPTNGATGQSVIARAVNGEFVPGAEVELEVSGYQGHDDLVVTMYSTPVVLGSFTADELGQGRTRVRIPEDATEGTHHLVVSGTHHTAAFALKVVRPATAAPGQGGAEPGPIRPGAEATKPGKAQGQAGKAGKPEKPVKAGRPGLPRTGA
ncbi:MAG: hypothetical protein Q4D89_08460 [Arachnia propionica]|uniref:hypothetical protein n=1 Tax=Arachnia propionica TaxID=1750 RepID=UPI0026FCC02F|nr:hypothetical protein [Arachnia propionica]